MLTPFGKVLRGIRLKRNLLLKNMADSLGYNSAQLSGIEHGRYPVPCDLTAKLHDIYDLTDAEQKALDASLIKFY